MSGKIYFNTDKVTKIELRLEQIVDRKFIPATPGKRVYLLGIIPLWKTEDLPDRWVDEDGYRENSDIITQKWYRVQELPKMLFRRPWVRVNLGYKEEVDEYFDTDAEAQELIDSIVNVSKHTFELIIVK